MKIRNGAVKKLNQQLTKIIKLLKEEFETLDDRHQSEIIKSFIQNDKNNIPSKSQIVLELRHLIKDIIKAYSKDINKRNSITNKIKIYINLLFDIARKEENSILIRSDSVFTLGQIGCIQYHEIFDTNNDFIFRNLIELFRNDNNEIIKNIIANTFWHLADSRTFPHKFKEDLDALDAGNNKTIKIYIDSALAILH